MHSAFDTQLQQKQFRQEFHLLMGLFISNNWMLSENKNMRQILSYFLTISPNKKSNFAFSATFAESLSFPAEN